MGKTLVHDIEHHAKDKADVILMLGLLFATELNPVGWQVRRAGTGNNSWRMYLEQDGKATQIWYFTGYQKGHVYARNDYHWHHSSQRIKIETRVDAIRFVRQVVKGKSQKKHLL